MLRDTTTASGGTGINGTSGTSGTSGASSPIYIDSTSGEVYYYDASRDKKLGMGNIQQDVGRCHIAVTDQYLKGDGDSPSNMNGFVLPWDSTLFAITMSGKSNTQTWTAQVRKNGGGIAHDSLTITNQYSNYNNTKNTDFNAGDRIMIYCNGVSIEYPRVTLIFRRRF